MCVPTIMTQYYRPDVVFIVMKLCLMLCMRCNGYVLLCWLDDKLPLQGNKDTLNYYRYSYSYCYYCYYY